MKIGSVQLTGTRTLGMLVPSSHRAPLGRFGVCHFPLSAVQSAGTAYRDRCRSAATASHSGHSHALAAPFTHRFAVFLIVGVVLAAPATPAPASAQAEQSEQTAQAAPTSARDAAAARALFAEGVACADQQAWDCAADRFGRAHALRPSPVIAYNYGHALVELGRLTEGAEMLRQAAREGSAQVRADAQRIVAELEPRLGRLTLEVSGPLERATVRIGQTELPAELFGIAQPIDPGEHEITATRDGEVVASTRVTIAEGGAAEASLAIPDLPPEPSPAERETEVRIERVVVEAPRSSDDGVWIGIGVGAGALLVAGGIVLAVFLTQPSESQPYMGNLPAIEIGR